jgi:hypothetical protein
MLEELSDASPCAIAGENIVARIQIIRECPPGDVDFADTASDADPTS